MPRNTRQLPHDLIAAIVSGEAVAVLGAGASVTCGLPSWPELVERLIFQCEKHIVGFSDGDDLRQLATDGFYTEVADTCHRALPKSLYLDFMQRTFHGPSLRSSPLHRSILKIPFSGIITTNYDTLIEREYVRGRRDGSMPPVYTHKSVAHLAQLNTAGRFYIFKAHGHVDDVDSIILTKRDFNRLIHDNQPFKSALRTILATRTLVFVGHSLRDPDFNLLLSERATVFDGFSRRHFAIMPNSSSVSANSLADNYNIHVIPYSSKGRHAELLAIFRQIQRACAKEKQLRSQEKKSPRASAIRKVKDVMEHERRICEYLHGPIELERARFLQVHANSAEFTDADRKLVADSIAIGERREEDKAALERQLYQSQKMESLGVLSGGIAHDFNNILVAILGWADLALHAPENPETTAKAFKEIERFAGRARDLVTQILTFSRVAKPERSNVDIRAVINDIVQLLSSTLATGHRLVWQAPANEILVDANSTQITQAILNLVINARDAIGLGNTGTIEISLTETEVGDVEMRAHPTLLPGRYAMIAVTDSGCGMSKGTIERIFEPFYTTKKNGTGLGLSIVHGIVGGHGGSVVAESEVGKGSRFEVLLPLATASRSSEEPVREVNPISGATVVLVDDERHVLEIAKRMLEISGFRVLAFESAEAALASIRENPPVVVITDLMMPRISGFELTSQIRDLSSYIPIIVCSGLKVNSKDVKQHRIDGLLAKPFSRAELLKVVEKVLSLTKKP